MLGMSAWETERFSGMSWTVLMWEILISTWLVGIRHCSCLSALSLFSSMASLSPVFWIQAIARALWGTLCLLSIWVLNLAVWAATKVVLSRAGRRVPSGVKALTLSETLIQDCLAHEHNCLGCWERFEILQNFWPGVWLMINCLGLCSALVFQL